jgi:hypothetical protein
MDKTHLNIMHTTEPDERISEVEWMERYSVGKEAKRPEALDRARDMMRQYSYSETGELNQMYLDMIEDM